MITISIALIQSFIIMSVPPCDQAPLVQQAVAQEHSMRDLFVSHLHELVDASIVYDPSYRQIDYPCGDVPSDIGVCSDVVIRAFMKIDVCLQEDVHTYRRSHNQSIDTNIDHRRVRNLCAYFGSLGWEIPAEHDPSNASYYKAGDIIWWKLGGRIDHIGIVSADGKVLHNIGNGQVIDVTPFTYEIYKVYRINR